MRILVTGSTGFLGAHLCRTLADKGHTPVAARRQASPNWRLQILAPGTETIDMDLLDPDTIEKTLAQAGVDAVVNCAGYGVNYNEQDATLAYRINVAGAVEVFRAASAANLKFIQIGTSYEYGDFLEDISEETPLNPKTIYGKTKAAASLAISAIAGHQKADALILRLFSMYGPLEGGHKLVPGVMNAARAGKVFEMTPGGQLRDYTYVGDVTSAISAALDRDLKMPGNVINICSGKETSLRHIVEAAGGGPSDLYHWGAKTYRADELMRVVGSPVGAREALGWQATTSLSEGMTMTRDFESKRPEGK